MKLVSAAFPRLPFPMRPFLHGVDQGFKADGLGEKAIELGGVKHAMPLFMKSVSRQRQDGFDELQLAQLQSRLVSIEKRQLQIHKHKVDWFFQSE